MHIQVNIGMNIRVDTWATGQGHTQLSNQLTSRMNIKEQDWLLVRVRENIHVNFQEHGRVEARGSDWVDISLAVCAIITYSCCIKGQLAVNCLINARTRNKPVEWPSCSLYKPSCQHVESVCVIL